MLTPPPPSPFPLFPFPFSLSFSYSILLSVHHSCSLSVLYSGLLPSSPFPSLTHSCSLSITSVHRFCPSLLFSVHHYVSDDSTSFYYMFERSFCLLSLILVFCPSLFPMIQHHFTICFVACFAFSHSFLFSLRHYVSDYSKSFYYTF